MMDFMEAVLLPLSAIEHLFEKQNQLTGDDVTEFFMRLLQEQKYLTQIASLNKTPLHQIKSGSLVHYRCMIQDMYDPEFFFGIYDVRNVKSGERCLKSGMFRDVVDCKPDEEVDFDSPRNKPMERLTYYCVPIPGEADWVKERMDEVIKWDECGEVRKDDTARTFMNCSQLKRYARYDDAAVPANEIPARSKRKLGDDSSDVGAAAVQDGESMETENKVSDTKRTKKVEQNGTGSLNSLPELNFPLPNENGIPAIVKLYDKELKFKLNDMLDVIGILSTDPSMAAFSHPPTSEDSEMLVDPLIETEAERLVKNPSPSIVPRIHAVFVQKLDINNPLVPQTSTGLSIPLDDVSSRKLESARDQILAVFEQILFGDRLAAEYLLCHFLSGIYSRKDVVALGKFALNITGCPADYAKHFYDVISQLVTKSYLLQMSLSNMNSSRFVPKKDYTSNRLLSGVLQLASRTHFVINETALQPGQLDTNGVFNMTALGNVISWQKLDYDFDYHKQPFLTDLIVLVLSEGKSILKCDCHVPMVQSLPTDDLKLRFKGVQSYLTPALLEQLRIYFGTVHSIAYEMTADIQTVIEEDFVESRREDVNSMTVDDLHSLLGLARFLSLSHGHSSLKFETWIKAKEMEIQRKQRVASSAPPPCRT